MKNPNLGSWITGVALSLAVLGTAAEAQSRGTFRATPSNNPNSQRGVEAPPRQTVVVVAPSSVVNPFVNPVFPRQPVAVVFVPAVLLSDGTVVFDFGLGFEPVRRVCDNAVFNSFVVVGAPQVVAGNGVVISQGAVPTFTQPVPNQVTPSQLLLPSVQASFPVLSTASQAACFTRDGTGRVFVVR